MDNMEQLGRMLAYERSMLQKRLEQIERELESYDEVYGTIVIKKISGRLYYYRQWEEGGKLHSRSLGAVRPGSIAGEEWQLLQKAKLKEELQEKRALCEELEKSLKRVNRQCEKRKLADYTFEVYWEDEITARVYVRGADVTVSRFTEEPSRQLFERNKLTREELERVLVSRCRNGEGGKNGEREKNGEHGKNGECRGNRRILEETGLQIDNPYEMLKRTHGISDKDSLWFRFPGEELTSGDVLGQK